MKSNPTLTHYFYRKELFDKDLWAKFLLDVRRFVAKSPVQLRVDFSDTSIWLMAEDEQGETFKFNLIEKMVGERPYRDSLNADRIFCAIQTDGRPYDVIVTAILLMASRYFGEDIRIISDGKAAGFAAAQSLVAEIFPRFPRVTITDDLTKMDVVFAWESVTECAKREELAPGDWLENRLKTDQTSRTKGLAARRKELGLDDTLPQKKKRLDV